MSHDNLAGAEPQKLVPDLNELTARRCASLLYSLHHNLGDKQEENGRALHNPCANRCNDSLLYAPITLGNAGLTWPVAGSGARVRPMSDWPSRVNTTCNNMDGQRIMKCYVNVGALGFGLALALG